MLTSRLLLVFWALRNGQPALGLSFSGQHNSTPSWYQYVRAPAGRTVMPGAVLSQYTKGNVTNPHAVVGGAGWPTYLTRASNDSDVPTIVIDFEQNVVGLLEIAFEGAVAYAADGSPGLKISFSETLEFLTSRSDFTRSDSGEGVCCAWGISLASFAN